MSDDDARMHEHLRWLLQPGSDGSEPVRVVMVADDARRLLAEWDALTRAFPPGEAAS